MTSAIDAAALVARFLSHTGLLGALRPLALARFAASLRRGRIGPHLALRLHRYNTPEREAVVFEGRRLSYAELDDRIDRLARALRGAGVAPGDTVGLLLGNCNEFLEAQMAVAAIGATVVSIGYRLKAPEVGYILRNAACKALVFDGEFREAAAGGAAEAGTPLLVVTRGEAEPGERAYERFLAEGATSPPLARAGGGRAAGGLMVYTSGTTGKPKGAHRDLARMGLDVVAQYILQFPLAHDERHLAVCPLYHSAAPAYVAMTFAVGGTVVIMRHFDPEKALATLARERCTSSTMVPTMLSRMLALPPAVRARYDVSPLRWLMAVAAPLPTELARRVEEHFGKVLYNMYGATEFGLVTVAKPGEHTARPGTVGRVIPGNEVRLIDEEGHDVTGVGVGEIYVKSSMRMTGYHGNAE
ncbi:MAG: AMP-binding protein, partial [Myxococcota bacterium]